MKSHRQEFLSGHFYTPCDLTWLWLHPCLGWRSGAVRWVLELQPLSSSACFPPVENTSPRREVPSVGKIDNTKCPTSQTTQPNIITSTSRCNCWYLIVQLQHLSFTAASSLLCSFIQLPNLPQFFSQLSHLLLQRLLITAP